MLDSIRNAFSIPDLRRRILYTVWILIVFRIFAQLPVYQIEQAQLDALIADNLIVGFVDILAGGEVLTNFSVVAAGIFPYLTASLIVILATPFIPFLYELTQEGESGREKLQRYIYGLTIPLTLLFGWGLSQWLNQQIGLFPDGVRLFSRTSFLPSLSIMSALLAGSMLTVWFADLISENGIGQGPAIIVFGGTCVTLFRRMADVISNWNNWLNPKELSLAVLIIVPIVCVWGTIVLLEGQRRIPVSYGRRVRGRQIYQGQSTYIPLQVMPGQNHFLPIYAANGSLILIGLMGASLVTFWPNGWINIFGMWMLRWVDPLGYIYWVLLFFGVIIFAIFYLNLYFEQAQLDISLQRNGGFIPGIMPGRKTRSYLRAVFYRIAIPGAAGLALLATVLPNLLYYFTGQDGLYIVISLMLLTPIVIDTMRQLESQLLMRNYEGFSRIL